METNQKATIRIKINSAFRPGAPIDEVTLFAGRLEQSNSVVDGIVQAGRHVILFGERGVGKTSLAKVLAEFLSKAGLQVLNSGTINCDGTDDFHSLWYKVFRELSVIMRSKKIGFVDGSNEQTISLDKLLPEEKTTPDDIRYILNQVPGKVIIILDELDRIKNTELCTLLADTIKNLSDHSSSATLVLVGVADTLDELIKDHRSIERALVQVPMPRMSTDELKEIINKGLTSATMSIEARALDKITKFSMGLPHYTHLLGLESALNANLNDRTEVDINDINAAIRSVVEKTYSIKSAYNEAITSPHKNIYREVLLACALAETNELGYFTAAAVGRSLSRIMRKKYLVPSFARHLKDFCSDKRGPVLRRTGKARNYRFRFINPLMQPYAIFNGLASNLIPDDLL